jgi:hypothetical protein
VNNRADAKLFADELEKYFSQKRENGQDWLNFVKNFSIAESVEKIKAFVARDAVVFDSIKIVLSSHYDAEFVQKIPSGTFISIGWISPAQKKVLLAVEKVAPSSEV